MTILDLQDSLAKEVGEILGDVVTMKFSGEEAHGVTVYTQQLPVVASDEDDARDLFPYAIVQVYYGGTEDVDDPWTVDTEIQVAVHDDGEANQGHRHIAVMCQRIVDRFCAEPLLDHKYWAMPDIEWAIPSGEDDDTYPYFFGYIRIRFNVPKIGRRLPVYD